MRTLIILSISCIMGLLTACSATQFHYTSTAHVPHFTASNETEMNVMLNDNQSRSYGVIAAVDNGSTEYLLIASKLRVGRNNEISDFQISEATYIDIPTAREFNNSLLKIISQCDNLGNNDGYFYEFASAPEAEVQNVRENEIMFIPSVRFFFNVTDEGSTGELIFEFHNVRQGTTTVRRVDMDSKEKIEDLQELIQLGIEYFE